MKTTTQKTTADTTIQPDMIYSRQQVMEIMDWGRRAWSSAKTKGLQTHRHSCRDYVHGSELIRFICSLDGLGNPKVD